MRLTVDGFTVYAYTGARPHAAAQPSMVFVHGAANDHSVWALQSRYFAHHGHNVLAVDLPGHGRSDGAPLPSVAAIADWLPRVLDAADVQAATLVGHSLGSLASLACAAAHGDRVTKVALLGPAAPMPVSEVLLAAAKADDHVAFELINGWSHSPPRRIGGNRVPGMWMTGAAIRLMERSRPGVLHVDLAACNDYAEGLGGRRASALPRARRCRPARPHGSAFECAGARRGVAQRSTRHARGLWPRDDGRAAGRRARRPAKLRVMPGPRFFATLPREAAVGHEVALPDAVAHHAMRVLRLVVGDSITLFTGDGGEYAATLTRAGKREAWARIDAFVPVERESALAVTLVLAIAATDTMDAIVRRAVELGAAAIQPVVSERGVALPLGCARRQAARALAASRARRVRAVRPQSPA